MVLVKASPSHPTRNLLSDLQTPAASEDSPVVCFLLIFFSNRLSKAIAYWFALDSFLPFLHPSASNPADPFFFFPACLAFSIACRDQTCEDPPPFGRRRWESFCFYFFFCNLLHFSRVSPTCQGPRVKPTSQRLSYGLFF